MRPGPGTGERAGPARVPAALMLPAGQARQLPYAQPRSNTAMLSTWAVCGNMLITPAAVQR